MFLISGVLDQDAPDIVLESNPKLYARGRDSRVYKPYSFWLNMLDALYQSLVLFFISYGAYYNSDVGLYEFGTTLMTSCLCVMLLHQAVETKSWVITFKIKIIHLFPILFKFYLAMFNVFCTLSNIFLLRSKVKFCMNNCIFEHGQKDIELDQHIFELADWALKVTKKSNLSVSIIRKYSLNFSDL